MPVTTSWLTHTSCGSRTLPAVCVDPRTVCVTGGPRSPTPAARRRRRGGARRPRPRDAPSTSTVSTSAAVAANRTWAGSAPAVRTVSSRTATRSAGAPTASLPASGLPSGAWLVSAARSSAGRNRPRSPVASRSCISSALASSIGSTTACWSLPSESGAPASCSARAGPMPSARSRSVVGHRHTPVPEPPSSAMSASVRWVACTAVVRRPEHALGGEQAGRRQPVAGEARGVLGGLLGEVHVQGTALGGLGDDGERVAGHRPHRVHGHAVGARGPLGPGVHVAVAEAQLGAFERGVEAAREVAGVEQGEADARVGRGGAQGGPHGVRVGVGHPAGAVVEVVELGDGRHPGRAPSRRTRRWPAPGRSRGRGGRRRRTSPPARSRTCRHRRGCARAAPGGTRGCARWRTRAAPRRAAAARRRARCPGATAVNRPSAISNVTSAARPSGRWAAAAQ